jgi:hypothetical protein
MNVWLRAHGFSHKMPKPVPTKADALKQEAFIKEYEMLLQKTPENEPILFMDAVHPTMAVKISYCRNNRCITSAKEFRATITNFFEVTWDKIAQSMIDRINDNFSVVKKFNISA